MPHCAYIVKHAWENSDVSSSVQDFYRSHFCSCIDPDRGLCVPRTAFITSQPGIPRTGVAPWPVNSPLWHRDTIWHHINWSTFFQVMPFWLTASEHSLNQYYLITSDFILHSHVGNFITNVFLDMSFKVYQFKITATYDRDPQVNWVIQLSAVITRSNLTRHCTHHCRKRGKISEANPTKDTPMRATLTAL